MLWRPDGGWEDSCVGTSELTFTGLRGTFWIWLAPGVPSTRWDEGTVTVTHFTNGDVLARYRGRSCDSPSGHESSPEAGLCRRVLLGSPGTRQGRPWEVRQSRAREQGHEGCPSASAGWRAPWVPHRCSPGPGTEVMGGDCDSHSLSELGRASRTAGGLPLSGFVIRSKIREKPLQ